MHRNVKVLIKIGEVWQQKVKATTLITERPGSVLGFATCPLTASKSEGHLGPHVPFLSAGNTALLFQELS